jgi:hypothetical protein
MTERIDGDIAVGDRVRVDWPQSDSYHGREGTVVNFSAMGFEVKVDFGNSFNAVLLSSRVRVIDPTGLCRKHQISRCTICAPAVVGVKGTWL